MAEAIPRTISTYCERTGPGFWGEPLNALTNTAFLLAALVAYVLWRRAPRRDWPLLGLIALVFAIGIGSFLFHTRPGPRTVLADVIPIQLFVLGYLALACRRFFQAPAWVAVVAVAGLLACEAGLAGVSGRGGESLAYVPALAALFTVGVGLVLRTHMVLLAFAGAADPARIAREGLRTTRIARLVLAAAILFALSLGLRAADLPLCAQMPSGTHFLWHLLNALVLGILLAAARAETPEPVSPSA